MRQTIAHRRRLFYSSRTVAAEVFLLMVRAFAEECPQVLQPTNPNAALSATLVSVAKVTHLAKKHGLTGAGSLSGLPARQGLGNHVSTTRSARLYKPLIGRVFSRISPSHGRWGKLHFVAAKTANKTRHPNVFSV
jgi:hypothetical protein